ncbi:hypothetical protein JQS43_25405 [Natronosporangium hydrolyticum]|uniref:Uncharacterized protein n=1 Tax=Natronosporangium hydrolyticum TaxID=2811111 RepID=A0A895YJG4_9ACTN|nr:hypothetical protein [Natronosporangium hydrolyticum]QSB14746.1 hypothetical protein JQS43_25405 [Natronosporangium hydrolyticum]
MADIRRRQDAGEIASDLDPALFLLAIMVAIMGAIAAPITLPQVARRMGIDPSAPKFEARYAEEVKRLIRAQWAETLVDGAPEGPDGAYLSHPPTRRASG